MTYPWKISGMADRGIAVTVDPPLGKNSGMLVAKFFGPDKHENARLACAARDLLKALEGLNLECLADPLNPCWNNRPTDRPGLHWGSEKGREIPACSSCVAKAAIAKAKAAETMLEAAE